MLMVQKEMVSISVKAYLVGLWKKDFANQAHDSIGGCVSDNVAGKIFSIWIKEANEIAGRNRKPYCKNGWLMH